MENRYARLMKKYNSLSSNDKKEFKLNNGTDRAKAMSSYGKPKDLKITIMKLLSYLTHEKKLLFISIICVIINTFTALAGSYMLRPIINKYIYFGIDHLDEKLYGLLYALVLLGVIYGVSVLTQWLQQRLMLDVSQRTLKHLRDDLYKKIQKLPMSYFDNNSTGDTMSRFTNDIDTVGEMLNTTLIQFISGVITITGTVILMIYTNWILGLITIVVTPLLTLISKTIIKKGRGAYTQQQKSLGMINGFSEEIISGLKVVKVFNHEEIAIDEFDFLNKHLAKSQIKAQFQSGIMGPITHQLCNVIYAITAFVGGLLVINYGFDIGGLTISLNYTRQFNRPINEISMQMNTVFAALAGAERVFEVLDMDEELDYHGDKKLLKIKGEVVMEHVDFGYVEGQTILHDINLYALEGQKIAFVGSTGAGKTTITNLLPRFYDIKAGQITIDGVSIDQINKDFLRENIAMVLQDTHLFTGTVKENIRYGRLNANDEEVIQAAKAAFAHTFIMQLENGYDTVLENDGANLSQGQRQLINIARAAISHAPILVLDEATSSVDTRTEKYIDEGMNALMKNRTTFVIAHRLSTVRNADVIMVLEQGRIVERGNHQQLLEMNGRYADLYNGVVELD